MRTTAVPFDIIVTGAHVNETIDCLYRSLFYTSNPNQSTLLALLHYRLGRQMRSGKCYNQINGDYSVETVLLHPPHICRLRNTPRKK